MAISARSGARPVCSSSSSPTTPVRTTRTTTRSPRTAPNARPRPAEPPPMTMTTLRGKAAIAGVTDAVSPTGELELTGRALEAQMVKEALDDAGLSLSDIDGVCHSGNAIQLAEFLGITARFTDSTMTGGSVFEVYLEHAASAIASGVAECVLVVFAQTPRASRTLAKRRGDKSGGPMRGGPGMWGGPNPMAEWEMPYGLQGPVGSYAMAASRHMAK